jgi:hypothetical protein
MVSRIMFSLRKAAESQRDGLSLGAQTTTGVDFQSMKFLHHRRGSSGGEDGVPGLDTYLESQIEVG